MWLEAIRSMKSKSGLTTSEIANQSGIPEPTLEKLFAGKVKDPKLPTMQRLVHFFGYTLDDLDKKEAPALPSGNTGAKVDPEQVQNALIQLGFIQPGEDLSDADLHFLTTVGEIVRAWFTERE